MQHMYMNKKVKEIKDLWITYVNIDTLCLESCFRAGFALADDTPGDACHLVDNRLPSLVLDQGCHVYLTIYYTKLKDKGPSLKQSFSHPQAF